MPVTSGAFWMLVLAACTTAVTAETAFASTPELVAMDGDRVGRGQVDGAGAGDRVRDRMEHVRRRGADGRHLHDRALNLDAGGEHCGGGGVAGNGVRNRIEGGDVDLGRIDAEGGGDLDGRIGRRHRVADERSDERRQRGDDGGAVRRLERAGEGEAGGDVGSPLHDQGSVGVVQREAAVGVGGRGCLTRIVDAVVVGVGEHERAGDVAVDGARAGFADARSDVDRQVRRGGGLLAALDGRDRNLQGQGVQHARPAPGTRASVPRSVAATSQCPSSKTVPWLRV